MKLKPPPRFSICSGAILLLAACTASAGPIAIVDPSFEQPVQTAYPGNNYGYNGSTTAILGWTISGPGDAGVWNSSLYPPAAVTAPDGVQCGFIEGAAGLTSVSQTLTVTLQANSTYVLSIEVGGRADSGYNPGTDYSISLYAGSTLLTSVTPVVPPTSSWTTLTSSYASATSVTPGQDLSIVISTSAVQLIFDNVQLGITPVPEPTVLGLLAVGATSMFIYRRRN